MLPCSLVAVRLAALFSLIYFVQGVAEPNEGLIAQPVRSLLRDWRLDQSQIGLFSMLLGLPWTLKPVYGLLTDFVPLFGSRRKNYLVASSFVSSAALLALYWFPLREGQHWLLLALLVAPTVALAFSDVVADALMVEAGQPLGITGQLQSVQWTAIYTASILTGSFGGWLSEHNQQQAGFLICGLFCLLTLVLSIYFVREQKDAEPRKESQRPAIGRLQALRSPAVWATCSFLFLWNFNPFSSAVLQLHMTGAAGFSEQFYGNTLSFYAAACVLASLAYGVYCRRVPFRWMIHAAVAFGVVSTLCYWTVGGRASLIAVMLFAGAAYMTGSMIQLDLAARLCPPQMAGTFFALFMAVSNLGISLSAGVGGAVYEWAEDRWSADNAFAIVVGIGGLTSAMSWLLVPWLIRLSERAARQAEVAPQ